MNAKDMETRIKELEEALETANARKARKPKESKPCHCGCGKTTFATFAMGHDAKHKGELLRSFDKGDQKAAADLINHGWYTKEQLDDREFVVNEKKAAQIEKAIKSTEAGQPV